MLTSVQQQIGVMIFAAVPLLALLVGRKDERAGAVILLLSAAAVAVHPYWEAWIDLRIGNLLVDTATLVAFGRLALGSDQRWPLFTTAFLLLLVLLHLVTLASPPTLRITYLDAITALSYGALAALAVGTWGAWRARRAASRGPSEM